jgi:hypothetical protein
MKVHNALCRNLGAVDIENSVKHNKGYLFLQQKVIDCYNNANSFDPTVGSSSGDYIN